MKHHCSRFPAVQWVALRLVNRGNGEGFVIGDFMTRPREYVDDAVLGVSGIDDAAGISPRAHLRQRQPTWEKILEKVYSTQGRIYIFIFIVMFRAAWCTASTLHFHKHPRIRVSRNRLLDHRQVFRS